jgi:hypothetical protein
MMLQNLAVFLSSGDWLLLYCQISHYVLIIYLNIEVEPTPKTLYIKYTSVDSAQQHSYNSSLIFESNGKFFMTSY